MIQKSKKQIWLVYEKEYIHEEDPKTVVFVTTNFQKVKNFLTSKIKNRECVYRDSNLSKTRQLAFFRHDMRNSHREEINNNLSSYYYTYWYDGEEM